MRNQDCLYMINTFYPYIETVKIYSICSKISRKCSLKYIEASCSIQVLYPLLDILNQSLEGLSPASLHDKNTDWLFTQVLERSKMCHLILKFKINWIRVTLIIISIFFIKSLFTMRVDV